MFTLLATLFAQPAHAYGTWGNPTLTVRMVRPENDLISGTAVLGSIRVHYCGAGGYDDYDIEETIDPVQGWSGVIDGGDICDVELTWDDSSIVATNYFSLKSVALHHSVKITGATNTEDWTPFTVLTGDFSGNTPLVEVGFK